MTEVNTHSLAVQGLDRNTQTWVIRPAKSRTAARELSAIFIASQELTHVTFGWNGEIQTVQEIGDIPESISEQYAEWQQKHNN